MIGEVWGVWGGRPPGSGPRGGVWGGRPPGSGPRGGVWGGRPPGPALPTGGLGTAGFWVGEALGILRTEWIRLQGCLIHSDLPHHPRGSGREAVRAGARNSVHHHAQRLLSTHPARSSGLVKILDQLVVRRFRA